MPEFNPDKVTIKDLAVEEPEKEELEGRDPEEFLNKSFKYIAEKYPEKNIYNQPWLFSKEDGVVEINFDASKLPERFIDETVEKFVTLGTWDPAYGFDKMLLIFKGKRIISINDLHLHRKWLLKVIDEKIKERGLLDPEIPPMPETRQF